MSKWPLNKERFDTLTIHAGQEEKNPHGALATPIFQTSTFCFDDTDEGMRKFAKTEPGYFYARMGNPTTAALEAKCAAIEGGEAGMATSSGMGALSAAIMSLMKSGDHLIIGDAIYGGTDFVARKLPDYGIEVSRVDSTDSSQVAAAFKPNTKLLCIESVLNPTMKVNDVAELSKLAHKHGALLLIDNTFTPPPMCRPIDLGADIVVHSVTKYLNGHGDVVGGMVIAPQKLMADIRTTGLNNICGCPTSPFNSYLVLRGMKTLGIRFARHCANAAAVAEKLERHPKVKTVYYPGLKGHPQHELAKRQFADGMFGAMIAFDVEGEGRTQFENAKKVLDSLKLFAIAVSLGDPDSLAEFPAGMTHAVVPEKEREAVGIGNGLIRLSIGLENHEDLWEDLEQALAKI